VIKNIVSIFFSIILLVSLSAPTIIYIVDDSVDISMFLSSNDEEEKESENDKEKEVFFVAYNFNEANFTSSNVENNLVYFFKKYTKPQLNLISPPPQYHIL